jgi:hypothetical protein
MNYSGLPNIAPDLGIAGINLGLGFAKFVLNGDEDSFMSVCSLCRKGVNDSTDTINVVTLDGLRYEVGLDAALSSWNEPMKLISRDWALSTQYRVLVAAIVQRMAQKKHIRKWRIHTGLAADHFQNEAYRLAVKQIWYGHNGVHNTPFGRVEVESVKVIQETAGGFMALMGISSIRRAIESNTGVIVDCGRMTVNWVPFSKGKMDLNTVGSCDLGVTQVIDEMLKKMRPITRPTLHAVDVEAAIMGTSQIVIPKVINGQHIDQVVNIEQHLQAAIREIWPRIQQQLANNLGNLDGKLLIAIGGGSRLFQSAIRAGFPNSAVMILEDGQFSNARGLFALGTMAAAMKPS